MAYEKGDPALDTEYNDFIGVSGTSAFASQIAVDAAAPCVGAIYGVGFGNRGYGQSGVTLSAVTTATAISSAQWTDMSAALRVCSESQTGVVGGSTLIPPASVTQLSDAIVAHETSPPSSNAYDYNSVIAAIEASKFVLNSGKDGTFITTGSSSITRVGAWGGGSTSINCIFDFGFGSEDAARYFFNSGGQLRIDMSQPGGTPQDIDWNTSLGTRLGQVRMGHTSTSSTGSSALASSIGYYDLTGAVQTIIDGTNIGGGAYTANDVIIQAHRLNFFGANGGNGLTVRITITLIDQHTSVWTDSVSSGTNASFSVLKATFLSGIVTPSGTIINGF